MTAYELPANTKAATGYTHKVVLDHTDLTTSAANTAQTIELLDVAAGDVVHSAAVKVVTHFENTADTAFNSTTLIIGDDGSTNRFVTSTQVNDNDGSKVTYKAHTNTAPHAYTAANTVDAVVTPASGNLAALNAGEVHIYLGINKLADL